MIERKRLKYNKFDKGYFVNIESLIEPSAKSMNRQYP